MDYGQTTDSKVAVRNYLLLKGVCRPTIKGLYSGRIWLVDAGADTGFKGRGVKII